MFTGLREQTQLKLTKREVEQVVIDPETDLDGEIKEHNGKKSMFFSPGFFDSYTVKDAEDAGLSPDGVGDFIYGIPVLRLKGE